VDGTWNALFGTEDEKPTVTVPGLHHKLQYSTHNQATPTMKIQRQRSAPSLSLAGAASNGTAKATGTSVGKASRSISPMRDNSHKTDGNTDTNQDQKDDERRILLQQLQLLGNHLAGCVVEFLIEEVERKLLNDYAKAALGEESNNSLGINDDDESEHENDNELEESEHSLLADDDDDEENGGDHDHDESEYDEDMSEHAEEEDDDQVRSKSPSSLPGLTKSPGRIGARSPALLDDSSNGIHNHSAAGPLSPRRNPVPLGAVGTMSSRAKSLSPNNSPTRRNTLQIGGPGFGRSNTNPVKPSTTTASPQNSPKTARRNTLLSPAVAAAGAAGLGRSNTNPLNSHKLNGDTSKSPGFGGLHNNNSHRTFGTVRPGAPSLLLDEDDDEEEDDEDEFATGRGGSGGGMYTNHQQRQPRQPSPNRSLLLSPPSTNHSRQQKSPNHRSLLSPVGAASPHRPLRGGGGMLSPPSTTATATRHNHGLGLKSPKRPSLLMGEDDGDEEEEEDQFTSLQSTSPFRNKQQPLLGGGGRPRDGLSHSAHSGRGGGGSSSGAGRGAAGAGRGGLMVGRKAQSVRDLSMNFEAKSPLGSASPGATLRGRGGLGGRGGAAGGRGAAGRGDASRLMVKHGSVRNVMGMFENNNRDRARQTQTLPTLRDEDVEHIVESLASSNNPNEAPDSSSAAARNLGRIPPGRTRTPPKLPGSTTPPGITPDTSPKRGVQRSSSGIRMQRFLEKKSIDRSSSGIKAFMGRKGSGSSQSSNGSRGPVGAIPKPSFVRRTSSGSHPKRGVQRQSSRRGVGRSMSGKGGKRLPARQFSFAKPGTAKSSSFGVFAKDKVTNKLSHDTRKQKRIFKTQNALRKLKKTTDTGHTLEQSEASESNNSLDGDFNMDHLVDTITLSLPCGVKHDCALLFVDISGFTKLSTTLKVEKLSKTINNYFQLIVEHVEAFGGDILKFAGDAVFVEWKASSSKLLDLNIKSDPLDDNSFGGKGLGAEKAVITASACAARIIDKCADYHVYDDDGKNIATLNLHCAVGFGEVVGVHLGNSDRMEYFIIGEPIKQVAVAMDLGKMGEVVASPACLKYLEGQAAHQEPKVILSKSNKLMNPKLMLVKAEKSRKNKATMLADRLDDWDMHALRSLQKLMSPYVHPVVVENQIFQKGFSSSGQERFSSEAEIRDVFTVFIQPMVSSEITGNISEDSEVLKILHEILIIVNNELRKFKGQLRQYTVDDKGTS